MAPVPRDRDKLTRMEQAVRVLIHGLGEDLEREGLRDTPKRVAKALLDCTQGYHQDTSSTLGTALFHEPIVHHGDEGVVVVRDIDFASTSEETLLPFHGRCHVAYRPKDGVVLGLSKLARLTKQYGKRLQTQERLATEIALALQQSLECHGVAVVMQARHLSNNATPEERTNACVSGVFATKNSAQLEELLALLGLEDLPAAAVHNLDRSPRPTLMHVSSGSGDPGVAAPGTPDPSEKDTDGDSDDLLLESTCLCDEMEAAVQQLLAELGENPHRQGLSGSARRYVMSLLASTSGYHMQQQPLGALGQGCGHGLAARKLGGSAEGLPTEAEAHAGGAHGGCCGGADGGSAGSGTRAGQDGLAGHRQANENGCGSVNGPLSCEPMAVQVASPRTPSTALAVRVLGAGGDLEFDASRSRGNCCAHSACCRPLVVRGAASVAADTATGPLRGSVTLRLPLASQCEHHMLPFYGNLMVSYLPGAAGAPLPRTAVEQVVGMYTQRLQVQERITHQVADAVEAMLREAVAPPASSLSLSPGGSLGGTHRTNGAEADAEAGAAGDEGGVMVVCDAAHMCMVARGVENHSGSTTTFAVRGAFSSQPELRRAVLRLFREQ